MRRLAAAVADDVRVLLTMLLLASGTATASLAWLWQAAANGVGRGHWLFLAGTALAAARGAVFAVLAVVEGEAERAAGREHVPLPGRLAGAAAGAAILVVVSAAALTSTVFWRRAVLAAFATLVGLHTLASELVWRWFGHTSLVTESHAAYVLGRCDGNRTHAARVLGIGRNTLLRKLKHDDG